MGGGVIGEGRQMEAKARQDSERTGWRECNVEVERDLSGRRNRIIDFEGSV